MKHNHVSLISGNSIKYIKNKAGKLHPVSKFKSTTLLFVLIAVLLASNAALLAKVFATGTSPVTEYPIAALDYGLSSVVAGPNNKIWFSDQVNEVGKMLTTGVLQDQFNVPGALELVTGPDGKIWFSYSDGGGHYGIGTINGSGVVKRYSIASSGITDLQYLSVGIGGSIWFAGNDPSANGIIGSINTSGAVTSSLLPAGLNPLGPGTFAAGSDGNLWFTAGDNEGNDFLVKMTPLGDFTTYAVPSEYNSGTGSYVVSGSDGRLWLYAINSSTDKPQLLAVTTSGVFSEYSVPDSCIGASYLITGPDSDLWTTCNNNVDNSASSIVSMSTSGATTSYPLTQGLGINSITEGPDGNIWFTTPTGKVAKLPVPTD